MTNQPNLLHNSALQSVMAALLAFKSDEFVQSYESSGDEDGSGAGIAWPPLVSINTYTEIN